MKVWLSKYAKYVIISAISFSLGALIPLTAETITSAMKKNSAQPNPKESLKSSNSTQSFSKADQDQIIELFKIWKISSDIDLTDSQLASFLPKYKSLENMRGKFWSERRKTLDELKKLMQSDEKSEDQIKDLLTKLRDVRSNYTNDLNHLETDLLKGLTVEQQSKFFILNDSFRQEIRQLSERLKILNQSSETALK